MSLKYIYVASPWINKDEAEVVAKQLREAGFIVVSRWHSTEFDKNIYEAPLKIMEEEAAKDFEDVQSANVLVYLNLAKSEGKATELGMALMKTIPIFCLFGKQNNVFLHLPQVRHMNSIEEVIEALHG
jgi:nucleoside 2-deoxyribosyltransferase